MGVLRALCETNQVLHTYTHTHTLIQFYITFALQHHGDIGRDIYGRTCAAAKPSGKHSSRVIPLFTFSLLEMCHSEMNIAGKFPTSEKEHK